jgi:hypothetical protein
MKNRGILIPTVDFAPPPKPHVINHGTLIDPDIFIVQLIGGFGLVTITVLTDVSL